MLRHQLLLMSCAIGALLCRAAEAGSTSAGEGSDEVTDISAPTDGQIALTARNNGDGTWGVKRGPNGAFLIDGIARERAIAIVGAGPNSITDQERDAYAERQRLEARSADITNAEAEKTDEEVEAESAVLNAEADELRGQVASVEKERDEYRDENGDLRRQIASLEEDKRQLQAQVDKFDHDGDGSAGGSANEGEADNSGPVEIPTDWTGLHWTQRVKLAKAIRGSEDDLTTDEAGEVISAEIARRAGDASAPNGTEGAGNNGGE